MLFVAIALRCAFETSLVGMPTIEPLMSMPISTCGLWIYTRAYRMLMLMPQYDMTYPTL